jgi:hypothetical protein
MEFPMIDLGPPEPLYTPEKTSRWPRLLLTAAMLAVHCVLLWVGYQIGTGRIIITTPEAMEQLRHDAIQSLSNDLGQQSLFDPQ